MKHSAKIAIVASLTAFVVSAGAQGLQLGGGSVEIKPIQTEAAPVEPAKTPSANPAPATPKPAKAPTEIIAREASLDNKNHIAIFNTDVDVKDPQFNLDCDKLTVYLKKPQPAAKPADPNAPKAATPVVAKPKDPVAPKPAEKDGKSDSGGNIEKAIAEGNVIIVQDKPDADGKLQHYIGKGKKAVYEPDKKTCTLTGWPRVAQSLNGTLNKEIISKEEGCVIIMNQEGRIDVHGYHITRLIDSSALDAPTSKSEPKPEQAGIR
jgi:lipopolysaccharide export system protein LptA